MGYYFDYASIGETLRRIIDSHSTIGHGSEVAWAIWTAIALDIEIPNRCINKVQLNTDTVPTAIGDFYSEDEPTNPEHSG